MRSLSSFVRVGAVAALLVLGGGNIGFADDKTAAPGAPGAAAPSDTAVDPAAWQSVITGQIEAFRKGDAAAAFGFAASPFQKNFADPMAFMVAIAASGYTPIFTSVSESFGQFQKVDDTTVMQVVILAGPNDERFQAIYELGKEAAGWRVMGVQLAKDDSVST